jgi:hypothetical protein
MKIGVSMFLVPFPPTSSENRKLCIGALAGAFRNPLRGFPIENTHATVN